MEPISDYLLNYIIRFYINHQYKFVINNLSFLNQEDSISFRFLNNETIRLSLVSKKIFKMVSKNLNIIMDFGNYEALKGFTATRSQNEEFKLIKLENSVIVFNSLAEYNQKQSEISKFRKVLVKIYDGKNGYGKADSIISSQQFPDNVQISLKYLNPMDTSGYFKYTKNYKSIEFLESPPRESTLQTIDKLNSSSLCLISNIGIDTNEDPDWNHHDNSILFKYSHAKNMNLLLDYFEPHDFKSIVPSESKLKRLNIPMNYHQIIKSLGSKGDENQFSNFFNYPNSLSGDWAKMIQVLMNLKSLKELILFNYSFVEQEPINDFKDTPTSLITEGFNLLFSDPSCSIKTLKIDNLKFIDDLFLAALSKNTSITTLVLSNVDYAPIIKTVLPVNKSIRNLMVIGFSLEHLGSIVDCVQSNDNINLYSLTIITDMHEQSHIVNLTNQITSSLLDIKEYNIISNRSMSQVVLTNGSLINYIPARRFYVSLNN